MSAPISGSLVLRNPANPGQRVGRVALGSCTRRKERPGSAQKAGSVSVRLVIDPLTLRRAGGALVLVTYRGDW